MQPSRRAFLFGRGAGRGTAMPWQQFCLHLARECRGRVVDQGERHGIGVARLAPLAADDVARAAALCRRYGVRLALWGADFAEHPAPSNLSVLWIDPTVALTQLAPVADAPGHWRAEAGVQLAALRAVGLTQCRAEPAQSTESAESADTSLAAWLAGPAAALCATGRTQDAGVVSLEVLLADGTRVTLGAFGRDATTPLRGAVVQRLVPQLFELSRSRDAECCLAQPGWTARARLDALRSDTVNLAHLLLGHGATLAWVEATTLVAVPIPATTHAPWFLAASPASPEQQAAAARLDAAVKRLFDPQDLFGS